MISSVVESVKARGFSGLYLWTLRDNVRSRALYEHLGMQLTGKERELEIAGSYLPEVQYELKW